MLGHHLIQIGVALLLLTCLQGFAVPYLRVPRLARFRFISLPPSKR